LLIRHDEVVDVEITLDVLPRAVPFPKMLEDHG
jgi:hypothetical protein